MTTETRLSQVESELADVTARLRRLEGVTEPELETPAPEEPEFEEPVEPEEPEFVEPPELAPLNWGRAPRVSSLRPSPRPEPVRPAAGQPSTRATALDFEELFGGRVLAWIGGIAILAGAVLFLGMAISRGWLDEEARTIIAAAVSLAALLGGIWLHENKGRTDAAKALVGSAISGLFGTLAVATQVYSVISPAFGLVCGAAVAAVGFALAVRWRSPLVAALGSLGALTTPLLTGVGFGGAGIAFVAIALTATVAILVWQRWDWLALGAFLVSAPQLIGWATLDGREHLVLGIAVLAGFWLLYAGAALGYELRTRDKEMLPVASWLLLLGSCVTFVGPGYTILDSAGHHTAAVVLLFGFAAVQVGLGLLAIRLRIHRELGSLLIAIGIALSALGLGETFHGPALVVAWAAAAATLAALGSRLDSSPDPALSSAQRMMLAAGAFLALAIGHTLIHEAPPSAFLHGVVSLSDAAIALGACVAAAFVIGGLALRLERELGTLTIAVGIALVAFGLGATVYGPALVVAWAAGAAVLAALGSRFNSTPDLARSDAGRMLIAAGAFLALAIGHTLILEAPPSALVHGVEDLGGAAIALGACVAATFVVGGLLRRFERELGWLTIAIGIALVAFGLGVSIEGPGLVVAWAAGAAVLAALGSRFDPTPDLARSDAGRMLIAAGSFLALAIGHTLIVEAPPSALVHGVDDLGVAMLALGACAASVCAVALSARRINHGAARTAGFVTAGVLVYLGSVLIIDTIGVDAAGEIRQAGQTWLSAFWTVTGLGAVIVGLVRRTSDVRLAGLALLGAAIAKVWTFDLAELDQLSRVLSFIGLGILLLVGAFAYQRIKPARERAEDTIR